jgi:hypothetical protein
MSNESDETTPAVPAATPAPPAPPAPLLPPAAPGKRGFLGSRVVRVVVGIGLVLALTLGWSAFRNRNAAASAPGQGSCLWAEGTAGANPKIHKVDCSDPKAEYVVLSKIKGGIESSCNAVAGTEAAYIAKTRDGKPAFVLCLQQAK